MKTLPKKTTTQFFSCSCNDFHSRIWFWLSSTCLYWCCREDLVWNSGFSPQALLLDCTRLEVEKVQLKAESKFALSLRKKEHLEKHSQVPGTTAILISRDARDILYSMNKQCSSSSSYSGLKWIPKRIRREAIHKWLHSELVIHAQIVIRLWMHSVWYSYFLHWVRELIYTTIM